VLCGILLGKEYCNSLFTGICCECREVDLISLYIATFALTVIISWVFTRTVRDEVMRRGWLDKPRNGRHFHVSPTPRLGGVAVFFTFGAAIAIALTVNKFFRVLPPMSLHTIFGIVLPACLIFGLGLLDDIFTLGPYLKFGVQTIAAIWLYWNGFGIQRLALYSEHASLRAFIGLPLTILWVLLITNAFNLIDGLDGLSAGSALFSTLIIFAISILRHTPLVSLLSIVLAGVILGFLRYNFHPASIFLGDSGSLFIGFLLSALALASSQKATTIVAVAIPVVSFGLPLLDVCLSVFRRYMNNKSLFLGDDDHVHHKLIKRGFSHREAVLVLYAVAAAFGILSLTLLHGDMMIGFVLFMVGLGVWLGIQQLNYLEVYELAAVTRRLRRRKRLTANNLHVRRASESLHHPGLGFEDLCRIVRSALEPIGFCGISISFPSVHVDETLLLPLRRNGGSGYSYFWRKHIQPQWELRLELGSPSGGRLGDLYLSRAQASDPLSVDINLLDHEFRTAVCVAVERAMHRLSVTAESLSQAQQGISKVMSAGS
jgi:UDP-GlcNAc:undecaprenyl-phosphate/decaprenyl-phosphate GlcNAc-1-phosphate transferase